MVVKLEHWDVTDDYRSSVTCAAPDGTETTRVVAVAWCHVNRGTPNQKTWNIYHVINGGGPIATGLNRRAAQQQLRALAATYLKNPIGRE